MFDGACDAVCMMVCVFDGVCMCLCMCVCMCVFDGVCVCVCVCLWKEHSLIPQLCDSSLPKVTLQPILTPMLP